MALFMLSVEARLYRPGWSPDGQEGGHRQSDQKEYGLAAKDGDDAWTGTRRFHQRRNADQLVLATEGDRQPNERELQEQCPFHTDCPSRYLISDLPQPSPV